MKERLAPYALFVLLLFGTVPACAQSLGAVGVQSPILTIDSERLFLDSDFGKRLAQTIEAKSTDLAAENRRIEMELGEEEKRLTAQRAGMDPAQFRTLADAFDEKVQATRREQEAKNRALSQEFEQSRVSFLNAAVPVLEDLMRSAGAAVVLERRSIFLSANAIDITSDAIRRVNAVLGDGEVVPESTPDPSGTAPLEQGDNPPSPDAPAAQD